MNNKINLCNTCKLCFADCKAENVEFGDGIGNDNVIKCETYIKEKKTNKKKDSPIINADKKVVDSPINVMKQKLVDLLVRIGDFEIQLLDSRTNIDLAEENFDKLEDEKEKLIDEVITKRIELLDMLDKEKENRPNNS